MHTSRVALGRRVSREARCVEGARYRSPRAPTSRLLRSPRTLLFGFTNTEKWTSGFPCGMCLPSAKEELRAGLELCLWVFPGAWDGSSRYHLQQSHRGRNRANHRGVSSPFCAPCTARLTSSGPSIAWDENADGPARRWPPVRA